MRIFFIAAFMLFISAQGVIASDPVNVLFLRHAMVNTDGSGNITDQGKEAIRSALTSANACRFVDPGKRSVRIYYEQSANADENVIRYPQTAITIQDWFMSTCNIQNMTSLGVTLTPDTTTQSPENIQLIFNTIFRPADAQGLKIVIAGSSMLSGLMTNNDQLAYSIKAAYPGFYHHIAALKHCFIQQHENANKQRAFWYNVYWVLKLQDQGDTYYNMVNNPSRNYIPAIPPKTTVPCDN